MPNRILREGIIESERVNQLSFAAEVFYRRLMSKVDDYGRFHAHESLLLAACFPLRVASSPPTNGSVSPANVREMLAECEQAGLLVTYTVENKKYLEISNFGQRQRTPSKFPAPPADNCAQLSAACEHLQARARARSESYSYSESESYTNTKADGDTRKPTAADLDGQTSQRFEDWWKVWSKVRGTFKKHAACQAYISVVTAALEAECFECTRSYLASLKDRSNGYNPDNFLFQQAQDNFAGRWIPRKKTVAEVLAEDEAESERIDRERLNGGQ